MAWQTLLSSAFNSFRAVPTTVVETGNMRKLTKTATTRAVAAAPASVQRVHRESGQQLKQQNFEKGTINRWDSMHKKAVARALHPQQQNIFKKQQSACNNSDGNDNSSGVDSSAAQRSAKMLTAKQWQQHRKDRHDCR